jgi:hypothetical protein
MSSMEIAVYGAIGVWAAKELFVPLVKGSFARNLQAKDDADKATAKKLEDHEKQLADLKLAQITSSSSISSELGNINGRLTQLDTRIEKQGQAHDDRLTKGLADVTTELNRKLAATLNAELERTVREVLREELGRRSQTT